MISMLICIVIVFFNKFLRIYDDCFPVVNVEI